MNLNNGDNQHIQINRSTVNITKHDTKSHNKIAKQKEIVRIKENTKTAAGSEVQTEFLDDLELPNTSEEQKKDLGKDITLQEVVDDIDLMKTGKAAGPDGIPIDLNKKFKDQLLRPILDMLLEAFEKNILPESMSEAIIILLPNQENPITNVKICSL
ncbi:MAG: hypothetical protein ACRCUS_04065 [Anaerovoracaceae bacterium]